METDFPRVRLALTLACAPFLSHNFRLFRRFLASQVSLYKLNKFDIRI
jgi:hypothetical protein